MVGVLWLVGCFPLPEPKEPPSPVPGAGCDQMCERLAELECDGAEGSPGPDDVQGTPDDVPCAQACRDIVETVGATLHEECVSGAASCDDVDLCFQTEEE